MFVWLINQTKLYFYLVNQNNHVCPGISINLQKLNFDDFLVKELCSTIH